MHCWIVGEMSSQPDGLSVPPMVIPAHNLARWIHARLAIADGNLRWETTRTLLGIVPVGRRTIEVPASAVEWIHIGRSFRPLNFTVGVAAMITPLLIGHGWWALLTVPVGLWITLVSLGPRMVAKIETGETCRVDVCFGHQIDADLYIAAVRDIGATTGRIGQSSQGATVRR